MALRQAFQRWLFRLGRDRTTPIILTQRRIFIVPTRAGLLFAVVLAVMLIGAINYQLSLGHALVFLLAGLGLVAMVHTFRNLIQLSIAPGRPAPVFAGELARFPVYLHNPRRQTRRALELGFAGAPAVETQLAPQGDACVLLPFPAARRGRLDPGRIALSTRYPLGLFYAWSYPHPHWSCLVYPQPLATPLPPPSPAANAGGRQGELGQADFAGLRQRQLGDSIRHVAWKAAARDVAERPLLIKQFAGGADEEWWLDWRALPAGADTETRLAILTGWVLAAEAAQLPYGLRLPTAAFPPAHGAAQRDACLEALALFGLEGDDSDDRDENPGAA